MKKIPSYVNLRVPHCSQGVNSACCGPCCLKELGDFWKLKNSRTKKNYSKQSLVRLCKTTNANGTTDEDMFMVLADMGLYPIQIKTLRHIFAFLNIGYPILVATEDNEGYSNHWTVIKGYDLKDEDGESFILSDPLYGKNYRKSITFTMRSIHRAGNFIYSVKKIFPYLISRL